MKNLEFLHKYYPLIVRYRRSIAATVAGFGALLILTLVIPTPGSQTKVLVANHPISAGTTLTESDFTQKSLPDDFAWTTLQVEPGDLVGRIVAHSISANQPISSSDLIGQGLLTGLPENFVAISLPVSASTSASLLSVGNVIDVYGTSNDGYSSGVLVASRARILAIPTSAKSSMFSGGSTTSSIIVGVDSVAAISIAGGASNQGFTIALLP
jgi:Flp pilus assembly protein CpaB